MGKRRKKRKSPQKGSSDEENKFLKMLFTGSSTISSNSDKFALPTEPEKKTDTKYQVKRESDNLHWRSHTEDSKRKSDNSYWGGSRSEEHSKRDSDNSHWRNHSEGNTKRGFKLWERTSEGNLSDNTSAWKRGQSVDEGKPKDKPSFWSHSSDDSQWERGCIPEINAPKDEFKSWR